MEYAELLFALEVRSLALGMRSKARSDFGASLAENGAAREERINQWEAENPYSAWMKTAYEEATHVAEKVREFRTQPVSSVA